MNPDHPADLSPLSYGSGLALGLFLILGLPRDPAATRTSAHAGSRCDAGLPRVGVRTVPPAPAIAGPVVKRAAT